MKGQSLLLTLILIGVLAVVGLQVYSLTGAHSLSSGSDSGDTESLRDFASQLKANQLYEKSAEVYDEYVKGAKIPDSEKANIDFNTGKMLLDQVGDSEEALARFLRVTHLYSDVDPEIKKEARKLSAQCLEDLGRSGAAERELVAATELGAKEATEETEIDEQDVLATIGKRVSITRNDFDEVWKEIPPQMRQQQFAGQEGKQRILQEMVANKLFAEAARRKGYDRDPQFRRRIQTMEDSLLANKLMQEEVAGKVNLSDSDLQIFYEANKQHYADPTTVEIAHILLPDVESALAALDDIKSGSTFEEVAKAKSIDDTSKDKGGRLGVLRQQSPGLVGEPPVDPLDIPVPGLGKVRPLVEAAFGMSEGDGVGGPIESERGYHLLKLLNRTEGKEKDFAAAKPMVERDLRAKKQEERQAELVEELMKAHKVRVHEERLN
ncbi:MAG: peptidyl-prolyl cis-trans isomerase [Candidatus Omnitrophica bacterium]|nr:peptidyl-prolyl cis-trans isomerase [Candidatus Omnitrophota bacterium]